MLSLSSDSSGYALPALLLSSGIMADPTTVRAVTRWQECRIICNSARADGLDVNQATVDRFYRRFRDWYEGRITRGYLIRVTGIREIKRG